MKKIIVVHFILLTFCSISKAQNVGVGTTTPSEKLDVNGNVNVGGQLKLNGNAGSANQVMMKDASNNPVWGDMCDYKNIAVFDCAATAFSAGASNCIQTWTVPTGVTSILVECWGGGGGGSNGSGGGGGGYITAKIDVTSASIANFSIGAGGQYSSGTADGINGGTTTFNIGSSTISATGGGGGIYLSNLFQSISSPFNLNNGGNYSAIGLTNKFFGLSGKSGLATEKSYIQVNATEFATVYKFGDGGDAGNALGSGAKGGYYLIGATVFQNIYAEFKPSISGGGGGSDQGNGYVGRGGRIIIHY
jgi:hypothetical protein